MLQCMEDAGVAPIDTDLFDAQCCPPDVVFEAFGDVGGQFDSARSRARPVCFAESEDASQLTNRS